MEERKMKPIQFSRSIFIKVFSASDNYIYNQNIELKSKPKFKSKVKLFATGLKREFRCTFEITRQLNCSAYLCLRTSKLWLHCRYDQIKCFQCFECFECFSLVIKSSCVIDVVVVILIQRNSNRRCVVRSGVK